MGDAKAIDDAIAECKKAIESKDIGNIKTAMESLTKASHKMAEAMYKASSAQPADQKKGGGGASGSGGGDGEDKKKDEKVVDAEFEETKD